MKLALDAGLFPYQTWEEAFDLVAQAGFKYVEWSQRGDFQFHKLSEKEMLKVGRLIERSGLKLAGMIPMAPIASPLEDERHEAVEAWKRCIAVSAELGAKQIFGEMTGNPEFNKQTELCRRAFARSLEAIAPVLAEAGIHASLECHPGDFVEENDKAVDMLRDLGHKEVGYLYCMPHTFLMGNPDAEPRQTAREMILYAGDLITHTHIADTYPQWRIIAPPNAGQHEHLLPGWAEVPFEEIMEALREIGYDGFVSAPLFSHADKDASIPLDIAIKMREYGENTLGIPVE